MTHRPPYLLLFLCLFFFSLMTTGSILSPDSEIVYRVGESLANNMSFSLDHELEGWPGFGTAKGVDGKIYTVFGPLESIVLAPCIRLAEIMNSTGWYRALPALVPMSYHIDGGLQRRFYHQPASRLEPHANRFLVSFLNVLVSMLCVFVFWAIVMKLVGNRVVAFMASLAYAFGTMMWNYSGSLFSEPLATLCILISLKALLTIEFDRDGTGAKNYSRLLVVSGISLGLAVAAHLSAILFVPFFACYGVWIIHSKAKNINASVRSMLLWTAGCGIILLLIGYYNFARFGNLFETGRGVNPNAVRQFGYGEFVAPWEGLWGLLVSPSKGIFVYSPALLIGVLCWRRFHRAFPKLSWMLMTAVGFRLVFVAMRSDWHGGFCLGPRYLLMVIPLCILPVSEWLKEQLDHPRLNVLASACGIFFLFVCEQIYFCVGEVFSSYHLLTFFSNTHGVNPFKANTIYLSASYAPVIHLFEGWRGPVFLDQFPVSNWELTFIGFGLAYIACALGLYVLYRMYHISNRVAS